MSYGLCKIKNYLWHINLKYFTPYLSHSPDSNHIFTACFIIILPGSALNIIALAVSEYPVYHSLYDDYVWMERFGDPLFHRHVACTERATLSNSKVQLCSFIMLTNPFYCVIMQWQVFGV
jgi:hypothetical protein